MKKIIFLISLVISFFAVDTMAQVVTADLDTITNSGTATSTLTPGGGSIGVGCQVVVTKISGTVAGTVVIQGSIDGTTFTTIPGADTLTLTDVSSQSYLWNFSPSMYNKLRAYGTGSGTMAASIRLYSLKR